MKNFKKKLVTFALTMIFSLSMSLTAFAAEEIETTDGTEIVDETAVLKDCRLTFSLTDETNGIFTDEIMITLLNLDTSLEYNYTITSADYLFGIPVGGNIKQGNYKIALSYIGKDQFTIQNADGTTISSFVADSTEHTFDWVVVAKNDTSNDMSLQNDVSTDVPTSTYVAATGDEEGDKLWDTFLNNVSVIETDNKYSLILKIVRNTANTYAKCYAEATGCNEEDYLNMTTYEQFLWCSTYLLPVEAITSSDYDTYCGSVAKWNSNAVGMPYNWFITYGTQEMADSYRALMEWDYKYFTEHGAVMNFLNGKTSLENNDLDVLSSEDANNGELTKEEKEELESLVEEENEKGDDENSNNGDDETEKGIWSDTISLVKDNVLTITILLILVGVLIGVTVYRKRKTIDDDINA